MEPDASGLFAEADLENLQLSDSEDEMLNEALMTFSTMESLSLTNEFPEINLPDELEYVASVRWRQLLAHWKRHELINILTSHPSSIHLTDSTIYEPDPTIEWSSSASTTSVDFHVRKREKAMEKQAILTPSTKNLSGLTPAHPFELQTLSRFTTHIGMSFETTSPNEKDLQMLDAVSLKQVVEGDEITVEQLLHLAGDTHGKFSRLIGRLAVYASQDYNPANMEDYEDADNVTYSVDIKDAQAIQRKADSKYEGELSQVKDILRAQVVFPTEEALVCAFTLLSQYCSWSSSPQSAASQVVSEVGLKAEIVRIKNLFAVTSTGQPCMVDFPTGYRHLLLNIRPDDGLLAGKCQTRLFSALMIVGPPNSLLQRFNFNWRRSITNWETKVITFIVKFSMPTWKCRVQLIMTRMGQLGIRRCRCWMQSYAAILRSRGQTH